MIMNIAIDGPAGSGKSTIAKRVAATRGCVYADTGAMYRAMAIYMVRLGVDPSSEEEVRAHYDSADIEIVYQDGSQHVILNGEDVTSALREEEVGKMASQVSVYGFVRRKLVALQQALAKKTPVVMDGRDIGTVVLPDAEVKIFLTASPEVRGKRRFDELMEKGMIGNGKMLTKAEADAELERLIRDVRERDERDMTREESPLKKAEDAILVDTSAMGIDEVTARILEICNEKAAQ